MKNKYTEEKFAKLQERINGLRKGTVDPSDRFTKQANMIKGYYNEWKTGEKGVTSYMNENASVALARQLEAVAAQAVLEPQEPLVGRMLFSQVSDVAPGNTSYTYKLLSSEGEAKPIVNYADDVKMVGMDVDEQTHKILAYGAGFFYSIDDVERAAFFNQPLSMDGAREARLAFDRGFDKLIAFGNSSFGIDYGLANQPTGTGASQVRATTATSASWEGTINTTKADAMLGDLSQLVAEYDEANLGNAPADFLLLPPGALSRAKQARLDNSGMTVLERFKASNPGIEVMAWSKLQDIDDSSAGSYDARGILGSRRSDTAELIVAKEFQLLPPQAVNLAFKLVGHGKVGGIAIKKRVNLRYLTSLPTE